METLGRMLANGYTVRFSAEVDRVRAQVTIAGEPDVGITRPSLTDVMVSLATIFGP